MRICITHLSTGRRFYFEFEDRKSAADALAVLQEYGVPVFLERFGDRAVSD